MENNNATKTTKLVMTALCTAILAVLSQLSIPMPSGVPVSLQTFAVALCGYILGWKYGTASIFVYILLGAAGVPVFTGLRGGAGHLAGLTAGFIWGFIPMVFLCGAGVKKGISKNPLQTAKALALGFAGIIICHAAGVFWYSFVSGNSLAASFVSVSMPFLLKDVLSVAAGYFVAFAVQKALCRAGIVKLTA